MELRLWLGLRLRVGALLGWVMSSDVRICWISVGSRIVGIVGTCALVHVLALLISSVSSKEGW